MVLQADVTSAQPGGQVTLTVRYADGVGCSAADLLISYDTDVFEYQADSFVQGDLLKGYMVAHHCLNGQYLISLAGDVLMDQPGELFTLTFRVDSSARGEYPIYIHTRSAADYEIQPLTAQTVTATVVVSGQPISNYAVEPVILQDSMGNIHVVQATTTPEDPLQVKEKYTQVLPETTTDTSPSSQEIAPVQPGDHSYPWMFGGLGTMALVIFSAWVWCRGQETQFAYPSDDLIEQEEE